MMIATLLVLAPGTQALPGDGFGRQVVAEINLARTQPRRYAQYLRELRRSYWGKFYRAPGSLATVVTSEGGGAVDEAIGFVERQAPLPPLTWSDGLALAAAELVRDEGQNGDVGHRGRRSGTMQQRIERHGDWSNRIAENIGYGPEDPRLMVMELIIDDGVPDRGHRKNIYSRALKVAGAACGPHPVYRNMCVIDFASFFRK
ncbi:CAP domain-containing protein [Geomonas sp. Red32]|uniref:CAP domain-containing protein n=1 Tax=Geomonas sp. Red32 TaxID=2912856 RepID=UPI00202D01C8|nr:CAP domain-containing protein [Geomonas sp. Red32]MCM0082398.1 CAP domain-containing protein [Geomonas sp. Red32]